MAEADRGFQPGTLWARVVERTRRALARKALQPIETQAFPLEQGGVCFQLRVVRQLARKDQERKAASATGRDADPFLPYEEDLFVADVSATHVCLLNKFNVIPHHLLVVTRAFEHQDEVLAAADFAALAACMAEFPSLGFYNGGIAAGASQSHKHLQLVPLPLAAAGLPVPLEAILRPAIPASPAALPALPFRHALVALEADVFARPAEAGALLHAHYRALLTRVGVATHRRDGNERTSTPYNLLLTRAWMLLVPRSREHFDSISVSALGFAGSFFLRNEAELERVKEYGPMSVLRDVAFGPPSE